jgi:PhoPQ-activated pathogenicity-related protein
MDASESSSVLHNRIGQTIQDIAEINIAQTAVRKTLSAHSTDRFSDFRYGVGIEPVRMIKEYLRIFLSACNPRCAHEATFLRAALYDDILHDLIRSR